MDWIGLAQNRDQWKALVNAVMNLWDSYNIGKIWGGCTIDGLSRIFISWAGVEPSALLLRPLYGLLYQPRMMMDDDYEEWCLLGCYAVWLL
jgi:hypothetical protein